MSTFDEIVDRIAKRTIAAADMADDFTGGVVEIVDAIKQAAVDGEFRIDQDVPTSDEAYVLRLEHSDGRRLKTVIPAAKVPADPEVLLLALVASSKALAYTLLTGQGIIEPALQAHGEEQVSRLIRPGE